MSNDICSKCVLTEKFPRIKYDDNGVCNYCNHEEKKGQDLSVLIENTKEKLATLLEQYTGKSDYDAIMCYSGGKDSTYTLNLAVKKYNLNVLAFTFDNGFIPLNVFDNIKKVTDKLNVDHIIFKPSLNNLAPIFKASALNDIYNPKTLTRISAICNSCISIVNNTALKIALEKSVPFIIAGFTLGQIPANSIIYQNNYSFLEESREKSLNALRTNAGNFIDKYFCLSPKLIDQVENYPYTLNLLCLENITEEEILNSLKDLDWTPPTNVDGCSSNCELNTFNNYIHKKRFGYNPYELELSHLIRNDLLSREEAIEKMEKQPLDKLNYIMEKLDISNDEIDKLGHNE